jgi:enamine deaminase RidA (YjgF/YER057c/UK114 family)
MGLSHGGGETVFVSGTASIDPAGRTRHLDQLDAQILETLLDISALLAPLGGGLEDICLATVFFKEARSFEAFKQVTQLLGVPSFPVVPMVADVCRSELLVEIEAIAAVPGTAQSWQHGGQS